MHTATESDSLRTETDTRTAADRSRIVLIHWTTHSSRNRLAIELRFSYSPAP